MTSIQAMRWRHQCRSGTRGGALERENKELRRANETLKLASQSLTKAELNRQMN
jgi:hypothetical protein